MTEAHPEMVVISKANAGIPKYHEGHIHYSGTPELMASYAAMAVDAGARIIGGCCGTSPEHLAGMRQALDAYVKADRPDHDAITARIGPFLHRPSANRRRRDGRSAAADLTPNDHSKCGRGAKKLRTNDGNGTWSCILRIILRFSTFVREMG